MRKKVYIIIILMMLGTFFSGMTYSFFNSSTTLTSSNQGIASFVFETNSLDRIDLDLNGLIPGEKREYLFSVTNTRDGVISDVTAEYQLSIKTYHFMPLTIELYQVTEEGDVIFGVCDETSARNSSNELVCNMPISTLVNSKTQVDNYKLKIAFPEEFNDVSYSNLVDYLNIEIDSWQKI